MFNRESLHFHFFYIVIILAMVIVWLISKSYGCNDDLVSYVSFASTLVAIILGLLAIVYRAYGTPDNMQLENIPRPWQGHTSLGKVVLSR